MRALLGVNVTAITTDIIRKYLILCFFISPLALWKIYELYQAVDKYIEPTLKGLAG